MTACAIACDPAHDDALQRRAAALAQRLGLPLHGAANEVDPDLALVVTPARLELRVIGAIANQPDLRGGHAIAADWTALDVSPGAGARLSQPIAKAVGRRKGRPPPTILDATAGLGEDAFLLASLGCQVLCLERQPVLFALLEDALTRARQAGLPAAERMQVMHGDTITLLNADARPFPDPEVVYLDPMFPAGLRRAQSSRRRALERKPMRVLRLLAGGDEDAPALLAAARRIARHRVVVKRPRHAPPLAPNPLVSHAGKATRYDVYGPGPTCPFHQ